MPPNATAIMSQLSRRRRSSKSSHAKNPLMKGSAPKKKTAFAIVVLNNAQM